MLRLRSFKIDRIPCVFLIILDFLASEWSSGVPGGPFGIQGEVREILWGPREVLEGSGVVSEKHHFLFFQR